MINTIFYGLFSSGSSEVVSVTDFLICVVCALVIGLFLACVYMYRTRVSKSFVVTLALLPAVVCVVIMMVNGNLGAGVAVAGAFSLTRFRSVPGTAREICAIFLAMGAGLVLGMGYVAYAFLFTLLVGLVMLLYSRLNFGARRGKALCKTLRITIPENLNYTDVFDPLLQAYASEYELVQVRTTDLGSLFRLTYHITLRTSGSEKQLIDELRCRNGNLEISLSRQEAAAEEL